MEDSNLENNSLRQDNIAPPDNLSIHEKDFAVVEQKIKHKLSIHFKKENLKTMLFISLGILLIFAGILLFILLGCVKITSPEDII